MSDERAQSISKLADELDSEGMLGHLRNFPDDLDFKGLDDELTIHINGQGISSGDAEWDFEPDPATYTVPVSDPPFVSGDNELALTLSASTENEGTIRVEQLDCYLD